MWKEEYEVHIHTYKHRGAHIPQELICSPARAGNGGSRKEITVATSQVLCTDRPCFTDFTVESAGLELPSLWLAVQHPVLSSVHSTLSPQYTVTIKK